MEPQTSKATKTLVEKWYDAHTKREAHRLDEGRLEFEVTKRVISSCITELRQEEARILDIGGGPGRYGRNGPSKYCCVKLPRSDWLTAISLAKQGHRVTLNDLSEKSLEIARTNAEKDSLSFEAIIHANALNITQHANPGSFDIVLCLGPLYHLLNPEERTDVVKNSISMAKAGGYVILAYVTVYAHLRDMARHDPSRLLEEWDFYKIYLQSGTYTRRMNNESFHIYPAGLEKELEVSKGHARIVRTVSCEGFLGFENARELGNLSAEELERWVDLVMQSADEDQTLNSADHLVVILKKF